MPHKHVAPPGTSRQGGNVVQFRGSWNRSLLSQPRPKNQALPRVVLTAIPRNENTWAVKAVSPEGDACLLPGVHPNRLEALGAAVLVAAQCHGEVKP